MRVCLIFFAVVLSFASAQKVVITNQCLEYVDTAKRAECEESMEKVHGGILQVLPEDQIIIPDLCENSNCYEDPILGKDCKQEGAKISCSCPGSGYRDSGPPGKIKGIFCEDINECSEGTDECAAHGSKCINTMGGYECKCQFPFMGDGRTCTTENECDVGNLCHEKAECESIKMYQGCFEEMVDVSTVMRKDTMKANDCIKHCKKNHNTKFALITKGDECYCKDELDGEQTTCNLPCSGNEKQMCGGSDGQSSVYVTGYLHKCTCNDGYHGDGEASCEDINECEDENVCGSNGVCTNTEGSFTCSCQDGFIMASDGTCQAPQSFYCSEESSEAVEMWVNCETVLLLPCDFTGDNFMDNGKMYHVTGTGPYGKCEDSRVVSNIEKTVVDFNKGEEYLKQVLRLEAECFDDETAVIKIDRFAANSEGWYLKDIFLGPTGAYSAAEQYKNNPACSGEITYGDGSFYSFKVNGNCGSSTKYMLREEKNVIKGALHARVGFEGELISRLSNLYVEYQCSYGTSDKFDKKDKIKTSMMEARVYDKQLTAVKNQVASAPESERTSVSMTTAVELINVGAIVESKLSLSVIASSQEKLTLSNVVQVTPDSNADLLMSMEQIHMDKTFLIQPVRCWVEDVESKNTKVIVKNGCDTIAPSSEISVGFKPFAFVGGVVEKQQVRCLIKVCTQPETCKQECRDVLNQQGSELAQDWTTSVVSGPEFSVRDKCGPKYKGGCDHYCSHSKIGSNDDNPICSCSRYFKLFDDKFCKVDVYVLDTGAVPIVEISISIVIVFFIVIAAVYVRKQYKAKKGHNQMYSFARGVGDDIGEVADSSILQ